MHYIGQTTRSAKWRDQRLHVQYSTRLRLHPRNKFSPSPPAWMDGARVHIAMSPRHRSFVSSTVFIDRPPPPKPKPLILPHPELMPPHLQIGRKHKEIRKALGKANHNEAAKTARRDYTQSPREQPSRKQPSRSEMARMAETEMDTPRPQPPPPQPPAPVNRCVSGLAMLNDRSRREYFAGCQAWVDQMPHEPGAQPFVRYKYRTRESALRARSARRPSPRPVTK